MGEKSMDVLQSIKKGEKVPEIIYTGLDQGQCRPAPEVTASSAG
jgi:hypothetical protein